jgi:hypothetical protein
MITVPVNYKGLPEPFLSPELCSDNAPGAPPSFAWMAHPGTQMGDPPGRHRAQVVGSGETVTSWLLPPGSGKVV